MTVPSRHDVFICHSSKDKWVADAICALLEQNKIRCWIAPRDIMPGMEWAEAIIDAINTSRAMVVVFSGDANASPQVRREVSEAVEAGIAVIPFRIEDVQPTKSMKYYLGTPHWLDAMTPPVENHIQRLADVLKVLLRQDSAANDDTPVSSVSPMPKQPDAAAKPSQKSATSQDVVAPHQLYDLGIKYRDGEGVEVNLTEAANCFRQAAERGHALSAYQLGGMYSEGSGVEQNHVAAVAWYRQAAEDGLELGQMGLGDCYRHGLGVTADAFEALNWYRQAASHPDGFSLAEMRIGHMYRQGEGVAANAGEALRWYRTAASHPGGYDMAEYEIGRIYLQGDGVAPDPLQAVKWFERAASHGTSVLPRFALAEMYRDGQGVKKDARTAAKWFQAVLDVSDDDGYFVEEARKALETL